MPSPRLVAAFATSLVLGLGAVAAPASAATELSAERLNPTRTTPGGIVGPNHTTTPSTCRGVPATDIVQPDGSFIGTDEAEVILVLGSNADVQARGGDDLICVHGNHANRYELSTIDAGTGHDIVLGLSGALVVYGGDGHDVILGNGTTMWIQGGEGKDNINVAGATSSTIDAGGWNDRVTGSPGPDTIVGGQGDDGLWGWDGNDDIDGGDGYDMLVGGYGFDTLVGGEGVGIDLCHDYASPVHGADISDCTSHLTALVADDLQFG